MQLNNPNKVFKWANEYIKKKQRKIKGIIIAMKNIRSILNIKRKNSYMTRNFAIFFIMFSFAISVKREEKHTKKTHRAEDNFE